MRQERINRLVARATGDDLREIKRLGFTIADPDQVRFDPEPEGSPYEPIDWDQVESDRNQGVHLQRPRKHLA